MVQSELPSLSDLQREIMEIIWSCGEATVSQVRESISRKRPLARNTIQTMLVRLEEKGWLDHREEGRSFVYFARVPKSTNLGAKVSHMIDRLFAGSPEQMVNALLEYRGLSANEANRIRKLIQKAEKEQKKREGQS